MTPNQITNEDYQKAWDDPLNQYMMLKASAIFAHQVSQNDRKDCMRMALWRCLQKTDPEKNRKFTTSLYQFTYWAFLNLIRSRGRQKRRAMQSLSHIPEPLVPVHPRQEELNHIQECIGFLELHEQKIIRQYYLEGMTLQEIGCVNNYKHQSAQRRLSMAKAKLQRICSRGV